MCWPDGAVRFRGFWLFVLLLVGSFFGPFGGSMILPMFGVLQDWFGVDVLLIGLSITSFMIPFSVAQLFSGILSDMFYGRRLIVAAGFMVYGLGALSAAFSPNIWLFLASRAVQGLGAALVIPILMALVGDVFGRGVRGKVMGGMAVSTTLGATLGPLIGGYAAAIDWRLSFILVFLIASSMMALALAVLPRGVSMGRRDAREAFKVLVKVAGGRVVAVGVLGFIAFYSRISLYTYLSDILVMEPYGLGEEEVGGLLALAGLGGLFGGLTAGYMTDRIGRVSAAVLGFTASAIIFSIYASPFWFDLLLPLLFLTGFSVTKAFTPVNTMAVEVEPRYRATATSIYGFMRFLGYAAAPILSYPLYMAGSLKLVSAASSALMALGLVLLLAVFRRFR